MTATRTISPPLEETAQERPRAALMPPPVELSAEDGRLLLDLARQAVVATVGGRVHAFDPSDLLPKEHAAALLAPAAAFVTLREGGELRGCIGTLATDRPLWKSVISAAISAASHDPRFPPVAAHELPSLTIDVSVLGPAVPLEDPAAFQPGSPRPHRRTRPPARAAPSGGGDRAGLGRSRDARGDLLEGVACR